MVVGGGKCDLGVRRSLGRCLLWLLSSRRKAPTLLAQRDCSFLMPNVREKMPSEAGSVSLG
jgi:hypothetical protein